MRLFNELGPDPTSLLRALKTVALANGELADLERDLLEAARVLLAPADPHALDELAPIAPAELAAEVASPAARLGVLQACLLMAVADGDASKDEWAVLHGYRDALGVDEPRMTVFEHLAKGRRNLAQVEMLRRLAGPVLKKAYERRGLLGLYRFVRNAKGKLEEDRALAWRYRKLGLLPEGTLGREYWKYSRQNEFAFPGEITGPDEMVVNHDLIHVLTGYGTDPASEFEAGAFTAGVSRQDPYSFLFFVMLQFHMGMKLSPVGTSERGYFPPARLLAALDRGAACTVDLTAGWDHWMVIERPVAELCEAYNIKPA
jgi:hypothetical protein